MMRVVHAFVAVTLGLSLAAVPTAAQQQRHGYWQDEAERVQELIDEIRPLIERSRQARAADPRFLDDLEAVLGRYVSPWRVSLLADDFGDGDYTRNPAWTVHSGVFSIDPRRGLLSRVDPTVASRRYSRDAPTFGRGAEQTLIARGIGTPIGNLTGGPGGLSAAFDGDYDVPRIGTPGCARGHNGEIGHVGKDWGGGARTLTGFRAFGGSDIGFNEQGDPSVTITLQGSNDNFNADIKDLGSVSARDAPGLRMEKLSGLVETPYSYHRLRITNSALMICVAEVEFYQSGPPSATGRAPAREPAAQDIATPAQAISSGDLYSGGDKRFAFDDDLRTSWASNFDGPGNEYRAFIGQDFGAARHIRAITLTQRQDSANGNASRVDVQRWANGRWQMVRSFSIAADQNRQLLRLPASAASERWRLLATSTNVIARGAYWYVAEVEFIEAPEPAVAGPASGDGGQPPRSNLEDIGAQILKQILQGRRPATQFHGGSSAPPAARQPAGTQIAQGQYRPYQQFRADAAEISTRLEITNGFSIRLRLTSQGDAGRLLFGPYQGGDRQAGYRLAYNPGKQAVLGAVARRPSWAPAPGH
jgi:hypothetical protein